MGGPVKPEHGDNFRLLPLDARRTMLRPVKVVPGATVSNSKGERFFALVHPESWTCQAIGIFSSPEQAWNGFLGWPDAAEIAECHSYGWRVVEIDIYPAARSYPPKRG